MASSTPPLWQVAALVVVLGVASVAGFLYASIPSSARGSSTVPVLTCPSGALTNSSDGSNGGATYVSETVEVPEKGSGWGPVTNVSFQGVQFRLWPEFTSPGSAYLLQGTGQEPSGVGLAFVVFPNNSSFGGNPPPTNASVRTWFSPDGVFGVSWLSENGSAIEVDLSVAAPPLVYSSENVTLPSTSSSGNDPPAVVHFNGVCFTLQVLDWGAPGGPTLNATAVPAQGGVVSLGLSAGPPRVACSVLGSIRSDILGNATCLESGSPDHSVALLGDGYLSVTLMVRVG